MVCEETHLAEPVWQIKAKFLSCAYQLSPQQETSVLDEISIYSSWSELYFHLNEIIFMRH